ncbi:hypothetical protein VUR80DRAFT_5793 [Thermomyces stellatus]
MGGGELEPRRRNNERDEKGCVQEWGPPCSKHDVVLRLSLLLSPCPPSLPFRPRRSVDPSHPPQLALQGEGALFWTQSRRAEMRFSFLRPRRGKGSTSCRVGEESKPGSSHKRDGRTCVASTSGMKFSRRGCGFTPANHALLLFWSRTPSLTREAWFANFGCFSRVFLLVD